MTYGWCDEEGNCEEEEVEVWGTGFFDLPKYIGGKEVSYDVKEELDSKVKDLYKISYEFFMDTFVITNTRIPEKTEINVVKDWIDDNNESGKRPEKVTISLLANGKVYQEHSFVASENWEYTFTDLPVYADGELIEYSVCELEENIPEGYVPAYEEREDGVIVVHNSLGQGDIDPPPHNNPQTGDNIMLYLITLLMSLIGLIGGKLYIKKYN